MKAILHTFAIASIFFLVIGCKEDSNKPKGPMQAALAEIKAEYAPDKRVALFDVSAIKNTDKYVLRGESNLPEAVQALKTRLVADSIAFIDSIQVLPADYLGKKTRAIVNNSVANLRSNPSHSSELVTQATLGTIVKVYKQDSDWYYIQTPDKYLAWVDAGGIELVDEQKAENWETDKKLIYTQTYGHAYSDPNEDAAIVSDLTAGNLLTLLRFTDQYYMVRFPDGRNAYVRKDEAESYDTWLKILNPTVETLVSTAKTMIGVPYLWGGTSTKGVDCSGFTKTIYFLNGMVIPRDASQQVHTGIAIDSTKNFDNLVEGDLLFFGRKATDSTPEKVVHVGMWIGDNEFIHASDRVRISSMDKASKNYDEYNLNRYLRTKRIFNQEGKGLINLVKRPMLN
ncbi:MAG: C40 family peptidase [Maribacter sp.]|nr:C40 family peptidase [Maribacter sp.]